MNFAQKLESELASALDEMFVADDTGVPLNEIRDIGMLQQHIATAKQKYGARHANVQKLQALHQKKTNIMTRQAQKAAKMKSIAHGFGYRPAKGNVMVHKKTGHMLSLGPGNSWSHQKAGVKRTNGTRTGLSSIRGLESHLSKLHG